MIRLSVLYPSTEGSTFDHDYYRSKHVPLACKTWGLDGAEIDKGVDGPYVAAVHFEFDSLEAMGAAMGVPGTGRGDGGRGQLHDHHAGHADERDRRLARDVAVEAGGRPTPASRPAPPGSTGRARAGPLARPVPPGRFPRW